MDRLEQVFGPVCMYRGIHTVHGTIVPVTRIFELHGVPGMKATGKTYLL